MCAGVGFVLSPLPLPTKWSTLNRCEHTVLQCLLVNTQQVLQCLSPHKYGVRRKTKAAQNKQQQQKCPRIKTHAEKAQSASPLKLKEPTPLSLYRYVLSSGVCESQGDHPGPPTAKSLYSLCGCNCKATLNIVFYLPPPLGFQSARPVRRTLKHTDATFHLVVFHFYVSVLQK